MGPRPLSESLSLESDSQIDIPQTPKQYVPNTTRSDRIRIKTALEFNHSATEIQAKYSYTRRQIQRA
jgi:hypothetical protein